MADSQGLFDALAGFSGANINRPALQAFVANSQANNGLRSAQTEEALLNAQQQVDQATARANTHDTMRKLFGPGNEAKADAATNLLLAGFKNPQDASEFLNQAQKNQFQTTLGDPSQLGTPAQTAAQQGITGKIAEPVAVPNNYAVPPGAPQPNVPQTPLGAAQTAAQNASAGLHNAQTAAGGFNPHNSALSGLGTDEQNAIGQAIAEGRLDPTRVNSRNAHLLAQTEIGNPGTNFNRLHADAALQGNATFQQKAMSVDMLPGLLSHVTSLGKQLNDGNGYSDIRTVGKMQQWLNGETNDPAYTEYMTARNDTLLRLASVMRGVGMSDQAHRAETEAMAPTLAPYALDAWLKGQMAVVNPLLDRQNRITHLGEKGQGTAPLNAPAAPAAPAAPSPAQNDPLGIR